MLNATAREPLLSVPAAFEEVTGRRPSNSSCHRWRLRGVRGVKISTLLLAGRRVTTAGEVRRWIAATNNSTGEQPEVPRVVASPVAGYSVDQAEQLCREEGV